VNDLIRQFKPSRKPALETRYAVVATAVVLVPLLGPLFGLFGEESEPIRYGIVGIVAAIAVFRAVFVEKEPLPAAGRRLVLSDGRLRQYEDDEVVAEIDVTRRFEYKIVDRYDVKNAVFRLFQDESRLAFFVSDPGGEAVVKSVVQIAWPPRNRHAGRSYPPAA